MKMQIDTTLAITVCDDQDYMEWLYKEYYKLMFYTAWGIFGEKTMAEDAVSESCIALMKKVGILRELESHKLTGYIVSTVRNISLNFVDKQWRIDRHVVSDAGTKMDTVSGDFDVEKRS